MNEVILKARVVGTYVTTPRFGLPGTLPPAEPAADLSVTLDVSDDTPADGDTIQVFPVIVNSGTDDTSNVLAVLSLAPGLFPVAPIPGEGVFAPGIPFGTVTWAIDNFPANTTVNLAFNMDVAEFEGSSYEMNFEVTASDVADPDSTPGDAMGDDFQTLTLVPETPIIADLFLFSSNEDVVQPVDDPTAMFFLSSNKEVAQPFDTPTSMFTFSSNADIVQPTDDPTSMFLFGSSSPVVPEVPTSMFVFIPTIP